jgi:putative ABC transport system permease protein
MGSRINQTRLFRALLYSYPAEFRHEYGREMEQLFADRLGSESSIRLWLEAIADIAYSAPKEHGHILISDLRYGYRVLAATPAFTLIALLVTALGIGAATAVFSVVNAVLLRSLPYGNPERLVYIWSPNRHFKGVPDELGPNVPDFYDWKRLNHSFSSLTLFQQRAVNLVGNGAGSRIWPHKAKDPITFIAVPLFVLAVACAACLIPAWNAMRIDPIEALRQE